jgi:integration host factor subunit beta
MTKSVLVEKVSERIDDLTKKQVETIINTIFEGMKEALGRGEKIEIRGFGNFRVKRRNSKVGRNPKTGDTVHVPSKSVVHFKVGKPFHNALNNNNS